MKHTTILGRIKEKPVLLDIERGYKICVAKIIVEHVTLYAELKEVLVTMVAVGQSAGSLERKSENEWVLATGYFVASECAPTSVRPVFQPLILVNHFEGERAQAECHGPEAGTLAVASFSLVDDVHKDLDEEIPF